MLCPCGCWVFHVIRTRHVKRSWGQIQALQLHAATEDTNVVDQHNNNNTGYCNYDDDNHYNNLGRGDEEQVRQGFADESKTSELLWYMLQVDMPR